MNSYFNTPVMGEPNALAPRPEESAPVVEQVSASRSDEFNDGMVRSRE